MSTTQSAKSTIYYDCAVGNTVPYYDGTTTHYDVIPSCEVSTAMVSAASAGQIVIGNVYDVFWSHANTNICVAMSASTGGGGGWASDTAGSNTARGSGYSQLDNNNVAFITNKNTVTNCFNGSTNYGSAAAHSLTYLGSFYSSANGQTGFTLGGASSGGTAGFIGIWNMYNRVSVQTFEEDTFTSAANITAGTTGMINSSSSNRVSYVIGYAGDAANCEVIAAASVGASGMGSIGCGHDSTTTISGLAGASQQTGLTPMNGTYSALGDQGLHFFQAMGQAITATLSVYGNGIGAPVHTGLMYSGTY